MTAHVHGDPVADALAAGMTDVPPAPPKRGTTRQERRDASARAAARRAAKADKPPSRPRNSTPRAPAKKTQVAESVAGLHAIGGAIVAMTGRPQTGEMLASTGLEAGKVWAQLAVKYPSIATFFTGSNDVMVFAQLAMMYVPIVMVGLQEQRDPNATADVLGMFAMIGRGVDTGPFGEGEGPAAAPAAA